MNWSDIPGDDPTNAAMIKRDEPPPAPAKPQEDDRQAVLDAVEELVDFVSEDAVNAGSFNPTLQGPNEPDVYGRERKESALLKAIDDLLTRRLAQSLPAPTPTVEKINIAADGLAVEHRPGDRWSVR